MNESYSLHSSDSRRVGLEAGFSLLEALFIAVIVLIVMISLVPLFSNAIMSNSQGWSMTEGVSFGRTHLEELSAMDLDRPDVVITSGLVLSDQRSWDQYSKQWVDPTNEPDLLIWQRSTRIRQFSISDLVGPADEARRFDNPLDAATDPRYVHFLEMNTWVEYQNGVREESAQDPTIKVLRSRGVDVTVLRSY